MGFTEMVRAARERRPTTRLLRGRSGAQADKSAKETRDGNGEPGRGEQGVDFYDRILEEGNVYETRALYYPLLRKVVRILNNYGSRSILEVGSGNGFLAEMILRDHRSAYRGFDFSPVAIRNAADRTGRPDLLFLSDALDPQSYFCAYDTIVCTEVLEHIDADLDAVRLWRDGTWCVCSVPNFDYDGHVRYFRTPDAVAERYGKIIDIETVIKIARPIIPDGKISSYLRNLRWSRDDPSRFLGFLGVQTFDRLGGWFLFYGTKKDQGG